MLDKAVVDSVLSEPSKSLIAVSGGDIHRSYQVNLANGQRLFAKVNSGHNSDVLASEYESLKLLGDYVSGFYPMPVDFRSSPTDCVLLMNFHQMSRLDEHSCVALGRMLAEQHLIHGEAYGWQKDNYIGLTTQYNNQETSWLAFFREQRLAKQIRLAANRALEPRLVDKVEWLMNNLGEFIDDNEVGPSLLHGDLWGGNVAFDEDSNSPILFDPAPYFGDPEADLAMTRLFGKFHSQFYGAYHEVLPPRIGSEARAKIYNLYHALNHVYMFGKPYENLVCECLDIRICD